MTTDESFLDKIGVSYSYVGVNYNSTVAAYYGMIAYYENEIYVGDSANVKYICEFATGYDNIDLEYCKSRGIRVSNVRDYSTPAVVQHTFALAFYVLEHLAYYDNFVKSIENKVNKEINDITNEINFCLISRYCNLFLFFNNIFSDCKLQQNSEQCDHF